MKKKGLAQEIIIMFIIFIVAALVIIFWVTTTYKSTADRQVHKQQCKDSVYLSSLTQVKQVQFKPGTIECPIWEETLKGNPDGKIQANLMKAEIANLMAETWDVYGRGTLNLFEAEGVYCSVYSIIDFKEKNKKLEGLKEYLITANMPVSPISYMDYLTNGALGPEIYRSMITEDSLNTSKKYATVFVYTRDLDTIDDLVNKLGGGSNFAGTIIAGTIAAATVGVGVITLGGGLVIFTAATATAFGATTLGALLGGESPQWFASTVLIPYDSEDSLKKIGCEQFPISLATR